MLTVTTIGRVTADLELKTSKKSDNTYLYFSLAVNKGFGDSAKTVFLQCLLFNEQAERMVKAGVKKGSLIEISGDLDIVEYEKKDKTTGTIPKVTLYAWAYAPTNKPKSDGAPNNAEPAEGGFLPIDETDVEEDLPF